VSHHGPYAIVEVGYEPVVAISYLEPEHSAESGFALFRSEPNHVGETETLIEVLNRPDEEFVGDHRGVPKAVPKTTLGSAPDPGFRF
jgi:hypothetical protein